MTCLVTLTTPPSCLAKHMSYLGALLVAGVRSILLVDGLYVARLGEGTKLINVYKRPCAVHVHL